MPENLISYEDVGGLGITRIWEMYESFVNASQVGLLGKFGPGRATVQRAEGSKIFLDDGREVLDLTGGIGVLNHGHNHPEILAVRRDFAGKQRMEVHKNFLSPYIAALSHNVAQLLPEDLSISYFPNSGAEAVEGAVKLAYKFHRGARKKILVSDLGFHGKLLGAGSLTSSPEQHFRFPEIPGVLSFSFNDADSVRALVESELQPNGESDVYALLVETLNVSSMTTADEQFLTQIRSICSQYGIVLIVDEVYSGWGKTGRLFNFMRVEGFVPDAVVYAKSFGGGKASISGYTVREPIARGAYDNSLDATLHSTTYNGFGEEAATAIKAVEIAIRDDYPERAETIGAQFQAGISNLFPNKLVSGFSGAGSLWGLHFKVPRSLHFLGKLGRLFPSPAMKDPGFAEKLVVASAVSYLFEEHHVLTYFGSNYRKPLIVSFPLVSTSSDVDTAIGAIKDLSTKSLEELVFAFVTAGFGAPRVNGQNA